MNIENKLHEFITSLYKEGFMKNIEQIRTLIIQFITISAVIIGFTLPVLDKTNLVKSSIFLIGGLIELLIVIISGFFYLTRVLQEENNGLKKDYDKICRLLNITDNNEYQKLLTELSKKKSPDYFLDLIFGAFFIGLLLIVLSLIDFCKLNIF